MSLRVSSPTFVGRAAELDSLTAAVERARSGEAAFVLLGGESGVGKSRLLTELGARVEASGARSMCGDCVEVAEGRLPYAPIVAALRPLAQDLGPEGLELLAGPASSELAPLLPELAVAGGVSGAGIHPDVPALAQARLFEVLLLVLRRLGEQEPVLLVLEDIHWADGATRDFLSFLIRNTRHERLAVVVTYRSDELHRRHPLRPFLATAEREPRVERIELPRFSRQELEEQLAGILEEAPDPALVRELFDRSEGNPFFAEELLAASEDSGPDRPPLPDTLREALIVRVEALSEPAVAALRIASAAGRQVSHRLLASGSGFDEGDLNQALREAVAHHVLVQRPDGETFAFRHALLREAVYEDLLPGERSGLHLALGEALSKEPELSAGAGGAAAELAWHWKEAHNLPAALEASIEAGREAERLHASGEAANHFEDAIDLWESVPKASRPEGLTLCDLLEWASEANYRHGNYPRAAALAKQGLELLSTHGDDANPRRLLLAHEGYGRYLWSDGYIDKALEVYRKAAKIMPDEPTVERARVLASEAQILMLIGRIDESRPRAEEAVEIARKVGDRRIEGHALNTLGVCAVTHDDPEGSIALLEEALAIARETNDAEDVCRGLVNLADVLDQRGRVADSVKLVLEGRQFAIERGLGGSYGLFHAAEAGDRLMRLGRWDEALEILDQALERDLNGLTGAHVVDIHAAFDLRRGEIEAARTNLPRAFELQGERGGAMWLGPPLGTQAEIAVWGGAPEDAWPVFERYLEALRDEVDYAFYSARICSAVATAEADLAERARALGDDEAGRLHTSHAEQVARYLAEVKLGQHAPLTRAHVEHSWGHVARAAGTPDPARWAAAAEIFADLEQPFELAMVRWRHAEALLALGEREAAAVELGAAREGAERLGAGPLLREIESLARRARLGTAAREPVADSENGRPDGDIDRLGLTARELDVLRLLADGLTNKEIAGRLYISDKTASVHVSRILAKLDVRSRVEAAGVAHRLGLTDE